MKRLIITGVNDKEIVLYENEIDVEKLFKELSYEMKHHTVDGIELRFPRGIVQIDIKRIKFLRLTTE